MTADLERKAEIDRHLTRQYRALEHRMAHAIKAQENANRHLYRVRADLAEFMQYAACLTESLRP